MLVLPYRAKNPPAQFPYGTLGLIALNTVIYAATTESLLHVTDPMVRALGFSHDNISPLRMLTAMFLHGEPMHLIGNMLFLWIFGAAVEGRLGTIKFLALYLISGFCGDLLQDCTIGLLHPHLWNLGASGAIMGLAGAYLYLFPFATICVIWGYSLRLRVTDWHAQWVIMYFLGMDIIEGVLYGGMDGVGHLVHIGGAAVGFLLPLLMRLPRDTEEASAAQAIRSDAGGDYSILALHELEALADISPDNVQILTALCRKAVTRVGENGPQRCLDVLVRHQDILLQKTDPSVLSEIIRFLPQTEKGLSPRFLLRLGAKLEAQHDLDDARECYRRIYVMPIDAPESETALARMARVAEEVDKDKPGAAALYAELVRRFPNGSQSLYAESALRRLGFPLPTIVFSAGDTPHTARAGGEDAVQETIVQDTRTTAEDNGLAPIASGGNSPAFAASAREFAYNVGDTNGMVLRPIGDAVETGA